MLCLSSKPYNGFLSYPEKTQSHFSGLQDPISVVFQPGCILDSNEGTLNKYWCMCPTPRNSALIHVGCSLEPGIVKSSLNWMIIMCSQGWEPFPSMIWSPFCLHPLSDFSSYCPSPCILHSSHNDRVTAIFYHPYCRVKGSLLIIMKR